MPDYKLSKILSFGIQDHNLNDPNTFLLSSTNKNIKSVLADIIRRYKQNADGMAPTRPYYKIIKDLGTSNLTVKLVEERPLNNKTELNDFYTSINKQITLPIEQKIELIKPEIKQITRTRYNANMKTLMKRMDTNNPLFLKDTKKVINFIIRSDWRPETQKNFFKAIIATIPDTEPYKQDYRTELLRLIGITQDSRDSNGLSKAQEGKWINYSDILTKTAKFQEDFTSTGIISDSLLLSYFYSGKYFAPYRIEEISNLKMFTTDIDVNKDNYIEGNKIVLNIYKTSKKYGRITQHIPQELADLLTQYYNQKKHEKNTYLMTDYRGNQPSVRSIIGKLEKAFGASCNILRKSYITNLYETGKLNTNKQMKKISVEMRDSVEMMLSYRWIKD